MADRAHHYSVIQNAAGDLQPDSVVRVLQPGTETLIGDPVYPDNTTVTPMTNPFTSADGTINFYLDLPQRVRLGVTRPGQNEVFLDDIDLILDATSTFDQNHTGAGINSMTIGTGSSSPGAGTVALGNAASAVDAEATAVGHNSNGQAADSLAVGSAAVSTGTGAVSVGKSAAASGTNAVAAGKLSAASGNNTVVLGDNAVASAQQGSALGSAAQVSHAHSTAVGAQGASTEAQQVRLGTPTDFVDIPNFLTVKSNPGGVKYRLYVRDDGTLQIRYHFPLDAANLLTTGSHDDDFEGSNGSWAATNGAITNSTAFKYAGTSSMRMAQSAAAGSILSLKATAVEAHIYVGKAWMFRASSAAGTDPTGFRADLLFYDGSNVLIGSAFQGVQQTIVEDIWMPVDVRAVAPVGTAKVSLRVQVGSGGDNTTIWHVDNAGIFDVPTGT
jgi:trimeric autotransporter adhesin